MDSRWKMWKMMEHDGKCDENMMEPSSKSVKNVKSCESPGDKFDSSKKVPRG